MVTDPNDSSVITLVTIETIIMRITFWQDPGIMAKLLEKVVGTYITDHQRNKLCSCLKKELSLMPPTDTKTR